jgi:hypothetical protein
LKAYFDPSALLKRYVHEPGTTSVLKWGAKVDKVVLSSLCCPEVVFALRRLRSENKLSDEAYDLLKADFAADLEQAEVEEVGPEVLREAIRCVERTGLKASDSIHIATALRSGTDLFITADIHQAKAAEAMGLKVERVG